jgi:hypothetical protein
MQPDEEVQITMTRSEAMRVHAALSALCDLQKMAGPEVFSAMALTDAVEVIEGVLPRLREVFPEHEHIQSVPSDAKTYAPDPFEVKVDDVRGMSPQEAAAVFATQYDDAVRALLHSLAEYTDFTDQDFRELMDMTKALLVKTMPVPKSITIKDSQPYVECSDLITLGALAYEMYLRQDQVDEHTTKPF